MTGMMVLPEDPVMPPYPYACHTHLRAGHARLVRAWCCEHLGPAGTSVCDPGGAWYVLVFPGSDRPHVVRSPRVVVFTRTLEDHMLVMLAWG